jgi:hypothetical protein
MGYVCWEILEALVQNLVWFFNLASKYGNIITWRRIFKFSKVHGPHYDVATTTP